MNLRQKAKKLKRDNDYLRNMIIATRGIHMPSVQKSIVTLETSQVIDPEDYYKLSVDAETYYSHFNKLMAANLLHQILNYAEINKDYFGDGKEIITARIKVVDMN